MIKICQIYIETFKNKSRRLDYTSVFTQTTKIKNKLYISEVNIKKNIYILYLHEELSDSLKVNYFKEEKRIKTQSKRNKIFNNQPADFNFFFLLNNLSL